MVGFRIKPTVTSARIRSCFVAFHHLTSLKPTRAPYLLCQRTLISRSYETLTKICQLLNLYAKCEV